MKQRDVEWFRPLWRRVAVTAVCVVWAAAELLHGDQTWILITLGLTAYAVWTFFLTFPKPAPPSEGGSNVPPPA